MPNEQGPSPVTVELIRGLLTAAMDEIETNITRTAFSPIVYEFKDYAAGILDAQGRIVAQSQGGIPAFITDLGWPLQDAVRRYGGLDGFHPGDAVITNSSAVCGQHLNNVAMYVPVHIDGVIEAFVAVRVHWSDVGGYAVGSCTTSHTREIYQEGVQFDCIKPFKNGEEDPEILRVILANTRFPEWVLGDLRAQYAACRLGERRVGELVGRYGVDTYRRSVEAIWAQARDLARQRVAAMTDGTFEASSFLDDDGIDVGTTIPINVAVRVAGDRMTIDFSGLPDQVAGPLNAGKVGGGMNVAKLAMKILTTPELPVVEGSFDPLTVILPDGKIVSADANAPKAKWSSTFPTILDTILKAMAEVLPDQVPAAHHGSLGTYSFFGTRSDGTRWSSLDTIHGGWGASSTDDGYTPLKTIMHGDCKDVPVELQEVGGPVVVEAYEFVTDTGGAGRHRGGCGIRKRFRMLKDGHLSTVFDRSQCAPWGLAGGLAGSTNRVEVTLPGATEPERVMKLTGRELPAGTIVTIYSGGGGGYGDPRERDPASVRRDVAEGYVSVRAAREVYGRHTEDGHHDDHHDDRGSARTGEPAS